VTIITPILRWWRGERTWLAVPAATTQVPVTQTDMETAYQLGFQNGRACGELNGRTQVVQELEIILASRGRVLADVQQEEVDLAKMRTLH
jgi:hypothetical protein